MKRVALLILLLLPASLFAGTEKISPDLLPYLNSSSQVQVVVQYAPGSQTSCQGLLGTVDCLLNSVVSAGGKLLSEIPIVNNVVALVNGTGLLNLSNDPTVVYISKDRQLSTLLSNAAPAINAQAAWNAGYTGAGVGVALIDSGVNSHKDLTSSGFLGLTTSRIVYSQDFVPGTWSAADQYGHGTHIAGLIAGNGASSTGSAYTRTFKGIAPGANIVNLRVLDANGAGTDSQLISALMTAIALKSTYNIRVINLSLGRPVYESYRLDPVCQAVEMAWKKGIVVVVAAGNNGRYQPTAGYGTITSPGNDPYVITVGAMKPMGTPDRTDDLIASYSSKGPTAVDHIVKPDLVAPGNLLVSTETASTSLYASEPANRVPLSYYLAGGSSTTSSTTYFTLSGTSMAAGVV
ncbi:MAG TPA: S8 family serine peptidase, partial [Terriglobales bacterium]|nr:S8 family serine peptidase [Terriglobales bacterium]